MKSFSLNLPDDTRRRLRKAAADHEMNGLGPAARAVLESCQGELAEMALKSTPATAAYKNEKWGRLAVLLPSPIYDEIVEASASTGIGRQRLPGIVLVGLQFRFDEIVGESCRS